MNDRKTVRVACTIVNGVELRLADGKCPAGLPVSIVIGGPSALHAGTDHAGDGAPVSTEVDAEWFDVWLLENAASFLVTNGAIYKLED